MKQDRKGRLVSSFSEVKPFPAEVSLLVGEAAHNLRSCLDHIIYTVARPANAEAAKKVQFPIFDRSLGFKARSSALMPGVPADFIKIIERVQPYHRRKMPLAINLARLRDINNWDKHRSVNVAAGSATAIRLNVVVNGETTITHQAEYLGVIQSGKVFARLMPGRSEVGAVIQINPEVSVVPVVSYGMSKRIGWIPLRSTLTGAGAFIHETILPALAAFEVQT